MFILICVADDSESQNYFTALKLSTALLGDNNFHQTNNVTTFSIISHPELRAIEVNINTCRVWISLSNICLFKFMHFQFRDRYFMAIDVILNKPIEILYSPLLIHSGPVSLNLFHNTLLKYLTDQEGLEIKLKSRPIVDPHEVKNCYCHIPPEIIYVYIYMLTT